MSRHRRAASRLALVALAAAAALRGLPARAEPALAVNASCPFPIGSPRVVGMGGAFTGVGAGAEALICNPAAVMRPSGFRMGHTVIDYMLSYAAQNPEDRSDFGNVGEELIGSEMVVVGGFGLITYFDAPSAPPLGLGFYLSTETYTFVDAEGGEAKFALAAPRLIIGRRYLDGQLFVSIGLDASSPTLTYTPYYAPPDPEPDPVEVEYDVDGLSLDFGLMYVPKGSFFQCGMRVKGSRMSRSEGAIPGIEPFPYRVAYPAEWACGVAFKVGRAAPQGTAEWFDRALVDLDVRGVFPMRDTTGFERFRSSDPLEMRYDPLMQPALGVELELYTDHVWLWLGTYDEPARYADVDHRPHFTFGVRARLFEMWNVPLLLSVANDSAARYHVLIAAFTMNAGRF